MSFLGTRIKQGAVGNPTNIYGATNFTVAMTPADFQIRNKFLIKGMVIRGPSGSELQVFVDNVFRSATPRGDLNSWDPAQPLPMFPSQTLYFYWNVAVGTIPTVTLDCYTDDIL